MKYLILFLISFPSYAALNDVDKAYIVPNQNILKNPGFENGKGTWSASGITFAIVTSGTNLLSGKASGTWDSTGAAVFLTNDAVTIPKGLYGRNGAASCLIQTPSGTATHSFSIRDGSGDLVSTTITSSATPVRTTVNFIFPSSGTVRIRITSNADEPLIAIDDCYVGPAEGFNLGSVSQAEFVGSAYFATTTNCTFTVTSTSLAALSDADCPGPTVESNPGPGVIQTTDANAPSVTINNLPPGLYEVVFSGGVANGTSNQVQAMAISDGTTQSGQQTVSGGNAAFSSFNLVGYFSYTTSGDRTFQIFASAAANAVIIGNSASNARTTFSIKKFPLSSQTSFTTDQSDFTDVDCGATTIGATTTAPTKPSGINIDKQWCSRVGNKLKVRVEYSQSNSTGAANGSGDYLFTIPLGLSADTTKITPYGTTEGIGTFQNRNTIGHAVVGFSTTNGAGGVTLYDATRVRLFVFEPIAGGAVGSGYFNMADAAVQYTFFYEVPISGWSTNNRAPQLVNSVLSTSNGVTGIEAAVINCDGSSAITSQIGSWVSSVGNIATGVCTVTLSAGVFSSAPLCLSNYYVATSSNAILSNLASSATSVSVGCKTDAGSSCGSFDANLWCIGPR